jgi:hypothetical protein
MESFCHVKNIFLFYYAGGKTEIMLNVFKI